MTVFKKISTWWLVAFGTSDLADNPDASSLAARSAGHWAVGAGLFMAGLSVGVPWWLGLTALALLYAAWEAWQWRRDSARDQRSVARRWDIFVDWLSVQMGGLCAALSAAAAGWWVLGAVILSAALILGSAALMEKARADA
jgi:hypothetical protein